jgi:hypothetical protein
MPGIDHSAVNIGRKRFLMMTEGSAVPGFACESITRIGHGKIFDFHFSCRHKKAQPLRVAPFPFQPVVPELGCDRVLNRRSPRLARLGAR